MCSVLPEDKQGPVLDDIRKISKERRRLQWPGAARIASSAVRSDASPTADGLTGVYRSTSELSATVAADDRLHAGDSGCGGRQSVAYDLDDDGPNKVARNGKFASDFRSPLVLYTAKQNLTRHYSQ